MVNIPHGPMKRMKELTGAYTIWLDQDLLTVINTETNGVVHQRHQLNYIDAKYKIN